MKKLTRKQQRILKMQHRADAFLLQELKYLKPARIDSKKDPRLADYLLNAGHLIVMLRRFEHWLRVHKT